MKINEIEAGKKYGLPSDEEGQIIDLIKTNCSDAVAAMQQCGQFLYRGAGVKHLAFHGRSRENRRSLSMLNWQQEVFDKAMTAYGFTALRSNSIFCSGSFDQAKSYGHPFIIFPVNGFSFLWSAEVRDFVIKAYPIGDACKDALKSRDPIGAIQNNVIRPYKYSDSNLGEAILAGHEISVHGEYYAFSAIKNGYVELFTKILGI